VIASFQLTAPWQKGGFGGMQIQPLEAQTAISPGHAGGAEGHKVLWIGDLLIEKSYLVRFKFPIELDTNVPAI
jgi:hypothetical protein